MGLSLRKSGRVAVLRNFLWLFLVWRCKALIDMFQTQLLDPGTWLDYGVAKAYGVCVCLCVCDCVSVFADVLQCRHKNFLTLSICFFTACVNP